jgi:hypothetical protein
MCKAFWLLHQQVLHPNQCFLNVVTHCFGMAEIQTEASVFQLNFMPLGILPSNQWLNSSLFSDLFLIELSSLFLLWKHFFYVHLTNQKIHKTSTKIIL